MQLPAIEVTRAELHDKLKELEEGMTLTEVRLVLGGAEFKTEIQNRGQVSFWRFRLIDAADIKDPHEIYMGTFEDGTFTFGSILPKG